MSDAPIVESQRLTLRGHVAGDLDDCFAMWSDPQVVRHIGGVPFTREDVWNRLLRYVGHWHLLGFGFWLVTERGSGRFVGEVGFGRFERALTPPRGDDAPEVGWVLGRSAQGQGFATEAVRAVLGWGAQHLHASQAMCLIDPHNAASIKVADKCGFRPSGQVGYKGSLALMFDHAFAR